MLEELTIKVVLEDIFEVKGNSKTVRMICFSGTCECDNFNGKILPSGVDTQKEPKGELAFLSARYMMEGVDKTGSACKIFVENNGQAVEGQKMVTTPSIVTDSEALKYLEDKALKGTIEPWEKGVIIHIFSED